MLNRQDRRHNAIPWPNDPGFAFPFVLGKVPNAQIISWINISQAQPGTVQALNSDPLKCSSDIEASYEGSANGFKGIVKFTNPVAIGGQSPPIVFALGQFERLASFVQYNFRMTLDSTYIFYADLAVRVRAIVTSFNIAALTWNNVVTSPILSYSSNLLYSGRIVSCSFSATAPAPQSSQTFILEGNYPGSQFAPTTQLDNFAFGYYAPGTTRETVYGAILDCAPISSIPVQATITQRLANVVMDLGVPHAKNRTARIIVP